MNIPVRPSPPPTQKKADSASLKADLVERWRTENAEAIGAWNDFFEREGLPLARYRQY